MKTFKARLGAWALFISSFGSPFVPVLSAQTPPVIPTSAAIEVGPYDWGTTSFAPWTGEMTVSHDGVDAAQSGTVSDGQSSYFALVYVHGPASVSFWWKVSSEANNDVLRFSVNNVEQMRISGEVDWEQRTINIPAGEFNELTWTYSKNGSLTAGLDRGWIDQVQISTSPSCDYSIAPSSRSHAVGVTNGTVSVYAAHPLCSWYVWNTNSWITIVSNSAYGFGSGLVSYSLAPNPNPGTRSGYLFIADKPFLITQAGGFSSCSYSLSTTNQFYGAGATNDTVSVVPSSSICPWTATTTAAAWITILSGAEGIGDGTVAYALAANPGSQPRTGSIVIGNQTLVINQTADPLIVSQPASQSIGPGGTAVFSIVVTGTPPITYQWELNGAPLSDGDGISGASSPTLTLSDVQESEAGEYGVIVSNAVRSVHSLPAWLTVSCGYSLFPYSASYSSLPATDFVNVSAASNCLWSVVNTNSWVTILSNGTDMGNATVVYSVEANPKTNSRSGTLRVAEQTFRITQSGSAPTDATVSLVEALDTVGSLPWGTTGSPVWFGQTSVSHDGVDAAQSGPIGDGAAVTVQTTVNGPGTISFWWKVSSQTNSDYLKFFINAVQQFRISGETDWQLRSIPLSEGTKILKWTYSKNANGAAGLDHGWLDEVRFLPGTGCVVTLSQVVATNSSNFETGQVSVAAADGCTWAIDNTNSWIAPLVQVGEGNGDFRYTVAANYSPVPRAGIFTIGGQPFSIVQAGNPAFCFGAITPAYRTEYSGPGYGTVALSMAAGCPWSVVNTNPWVSIASSVSYPSGGGTVTYHVDANTSAQARSGYILIAGIAFFLTQAEASQPGTNVPPLPHYADFDVGRDFSTAINPNGVWTYGWAETVTGSVQPLTVRRDSPADNGAYTPSWQLTYDTAPVVICNISDQVITVGGGQTAIAPHEMLFDGGQDGRPENFVVIRFTAPSNGMYSVVTAVRPFYNGSPQGDADFHVVRNSTELFVQFLNPSQSAYYSNTLAMSAGETIKFLLGRGTDGHEYGSIFRIAALINPRPSPATNSPGLPIITLTNRIPSYLEEFGYAVAAMGNDRVLIGAPRHEHSVNGGAAYLFGTNGALLTTFTNPTPVGLEHFGFAVATVGDRILVSSIYDSTGAAYAGVVHVFSTNGTLLNTITNPTPAYDERFGWAMAAMGSDRVLIGTEDSGTAYLFNIRGTLLTTFTSPNPTPNNAFSKALVAVGNDRVLIGVAEDYTGAPYAGIAYLFNTNGALLTTITNPAPSGSELFGCAVAGVGNDRVLIGASGDKAGGTRAVGGAYLFSTDGTLLTTFTNPAPAPTDFAPYHLDDFGKSVAAVGNDRVLIGAPAEDGSSTNAGTAYLFSTNGALLATFRNPTSPLHDFFGSAIMTVGSDHVLIGAYNSPGGGAAYLFGIPAPARGSSNPPPSLATFDAARDFSASSNPSGVWRYGWETALAGPFNLFPNARRAAAPNDMPYDIWEGAAYSLPDVMHYPWSNPESGINGTSDLPPGTLLLDPGVQGSGKNFTVARFTAPSNSFYQIEAAVAPCYDGTPQGDTDFHVVKNGVELVGRFLPTTEHFSYATTLSLNSGDTIDFAVGRGADNIEYGSILKLTAALTPTNAPSTNSINLTNPPPACTYLLSPISRSHGYGSATGMVAVTTPSVCAWNVFETNTWITILSSLNNSNSGMVIYSLSANTNSQSRSGNIIIGTQQFHVTQSGTSLSGTNAPRLQFMSRTATNATLSVQGEDGKMYVVECSEDLIHWIPISTNAAPCTVTDRPTTNAPHRFYRTVEIP